MFLVSPATVLNRSALEMRSVPRRFLGRATPWPRRGGVGLLARILFEVEIWRYLAALLPFVVAMAVWPGSAFAIAQAPLPMVIVIYLVESRLLRVPKARRADLVPAAEAERGLDLLNARAIRILARIAARRGLTAGRLSLVIEQSELARVPPLTLVSVQSDDGPAVIDLAPEDRALVRDTLFAPPLTERALQRINLREDRMLRTIALDAARVSAHARLQALLAEREASAEGRDRRG